MSDIMEQIVGRMQDEYDHGDEGGAVRVAENTYLIDGLMPIDETVDLIGFEPEDAEDCETAGGLLLALFDRIPAEGDKVSVEAERTTENGTPARADFMVVDMDNLRINKIRVKVTPAVVGEE